jgi:hypothetical protein
MIAAEEPGIRPQDLQVADRILEYIGTLPRPMQKEIRQLLIVFEYLPIFFLFKPKRFSRLSPKDQERYIAAWGTSSIGLFRSGFRVLKSLSVSTYYQNPAAWDAIGYRT